MKNNKVTPLDQWISLNRILVLYKGMGVILGAICFSLTILSFYLATYPPVVVIQDGDQRRFYYPEKKRVHLSEDNVADFIVKYVNLRYTWENFDSEVILQNISPLTTKGLLRKIEKEIRKESRSKKYGKYGKKSTGKTHKIIKQTVANINPMVTQDQSSVSFDRIIRVDGIPLIAPTYMSFRIVKGRSTVWNPMGLYVDGITIHESR